MFGYGCRAMSEIKKFSWFRKPTAWESAQAWRAQRSRMVQAAQASLQRVQNQINSQLAAASSVDKLV